jgi:hypothetical protein
MIMNAGSCRAFTQASSRACMSTIGSSFCERATANVLPLRLQLRGTSLGAATHLTPRPASEAAPTGRLQIYFTSKG